MTAKTDKTAVVLIPPEDYWETIQTIRRQHDRQVRRWMPHVTLLYPFRPRELFDKIETELRDACRGIEPFAVRLAEFRDFHHGRARYTLWLVPEPHDAMLRLQAAVESAAPDCNEVSQRRDGFTPHLSVGQVKGRDGLAQLKTKLQASWKPLSFPARYVSLIWRNDPPDDVFRVDRSVSLR